MLDQLNIGLIGHGHLGQHIENILKQQGFTVRTSEKRADGTYNNAEIAAWADKLLLTVKPTQVDAVIEDICGKIKNGAEVISFAAAYPLRDLEEKMNAPVARAMTDIENYGSTLYLGSEQAQQLMRHLSLYASTTNREADVDDCTVGEACFPGIAAWQLLNNSVNASTWLQGYIDWMDQAKGIDKRATTGIWDAVLQQGQFANKLKAVATGKGITAEMVKALNEGERDYGKIFGAGERRIAEIVEECGTIKKNVV